METLETLASSLTKKPNLPLVVAEALRRVLFGVRSAMWALRQDQLEWFTNFKSLVDPPDESDKEKNIEWQGTMHVCYKKLMEPIRFRKNIKDWEAVSSTYKDTMKTVNATRKKIEAKKAEMAPMEGFWMDKLAYTKEMRLGS